MDMQEKVKMLENLNQLHREKKEYEKMAEIAATGIKNIQASIVALQKELVGNFQGRNKYTHEETVSTRRSIMEALKDSGKAPHQIQEALPTIEPHLLDRELKTLVKKGAVKWNGKMGVASKYYRG